MLAVTIWLGDILLGVVLVSTVAIDAIVRNDVIGVM